MQTAPHTSDDGDRLTIGEMFGQALDLGAGLGILLLPLLVTALPGVILFLLLPAALVLVLAAVPVAMAGAIIAPPYLLVRALRRRLGDAPT